MKRKINLKTLLSILVSLTLVILIIGKVITIRQDRAITIRSEHLLLELFSSGQKIIIGDKDAQKSLVIFYDYNCKHCRHFFTSALPPIDKKFIANKELNLILKPVNLSSNESISYAYQLLYCLDNIGLFDDLHQLLLSRPDAIFTTDFEFFKNTILSENPEISECMSYDSRELQVAENKEQLHQLGFKSTPTFVLENKVYTGKISPEIIRDILHKK